MRGLVKDVAPLNNIMTRMGEVRGAARRAIAGRVMTNKPPNTTSEPRSRHHAYHIILFFLTHPLRWTRCYRVNERMMNTCDMKAAVALANVLPTI